MQNKKSAFTIAEVMVSLLIISIAFMVSANFASSYLKSTYERDEQIKAVLNNASMSEELKAEVVTLPRLYEFSKDKNIKIFAVGEGEIKLKKEGTYTVVSEETNTFSEELKLNHLKLFRIEVGGEMPNTKITSVVVLK